MIGILLIAHAPLGQAFAAVVQHIFRAKPEQFEWIDVIADQPVDVVQSQVLAAMQRVDTGEGVLVVTDVIGATPSNCVEALRSVCPNIEVISGANVPMLLRALTYRQDTLDVMCEMALSGAHTGAARVDTRIKLSS
jgi:PTS system mannose-specific IIA component